MNINSKLASLALASAAFIASTSVHAGPIAEAVTTATTDFKADFTTVGGIVVGISLIGIGFVAAVRMLKRGI